MDDHQTHYDVLDLPRNATATQVSKQYRAIRASLLEMGVPTDDPHYEALRVAYRVLRDHKLRKRYDKELKKQRSYRKAKRISGQTPLSDLFEGVERDTTATVHTQPSAFRRLINAYAGYIVVGLLLILSMLYWAEKDKQARQQELLEAQARQDRINRYYANSTPRPTRTPFPTPRPTRTPESDVILPLIDDYYSDGLHTLIIDTLSAKINGDPLAIYYYLRGRSYRERNQDETDLQNAVQDLDQAIAFNNNLIAVYRERGLAYYQMCQDSGENCPLARLDLNIYQSTLDNDERDQTVLDALEDLED